MSFYKNGWTREKVIEKVKKEFKGKSMSHNGYSKVCAYRGENNTKCIAGVFMSDEGYNSLKETSLFKAIDSDDIWEKVGSSMPLDRGLMRIWQMSHDGLNPHNSVQNQTNVLIDQLITMEEAHANA